MDELASDIVASGGKALALETDVSDPLDIALLRDAAVTSFGTVDVWINNVGVGAPGFFWDISIEDHSRLIDVDLKGLIYGAHAALPDAGIWRPDQHRFDRQ